MPCRDADWSDPWYDRWPWCYPYAVLVLAVWAGATMWRGMRGK